MVIKITNDGLEELSIDNADPDDVGLMLG
jgi:hypothetical protein